MSRHWSKNSRTYIWSNLFSRLHISTIQLRCSVWRIIQITYEFCFWRHVITDITTMTWNVTYRKHLVMSTGIKLCRKISTKLAAIVYNARTETQPCNKFRDSREHRDHQEGCQFRPLSNWRTSAIWTCIVRSHSFLDAGQREWVCRQCYRKWLRNRLTGGSSILK